MNDIKNMREQLCAVQEIVANLIAECDRLGGVYVAAPDGWRTIYVLPDGLGDLDDCGGDRLKFAHRNVHVFTKDGETKIGYYIDGEWFVFESEPPKDESNGGDAWPSDEVVAWKELD